MQQYESSNRSGWLFAVTIVTTWIILSAYLLSRAERGTIVVHGAGPLLAQAVIFLMLLYGPARSIQSGVLELAIAGFFVGSLFSFPVSTVLAISDFFKYHRDSAAAPPMPKPSEAWWKRPLTLWLACGAGFLVFLLCNFTIWYSLRDEMRPPLVLDEPDSIGVSERVSSANRICQAEGVGALAFSPDAKYLATAGQDANINVWRTADWTRPQTLKHEGSIRHLAFSPDGTFHYAGGCQGVLPILCRFDLQSGKPDRTFEA